MFPLNDTPLTERVETLRPLVTAALRGDNNLFDRFARVFRDIERQSRVDTYPTLEALAELTAQGHRDTARLIAVFEVELEVLLDFIDASNATTRAKLEGTKLSYS